MAGQEFHLLRLVFGDGGGPAQGIEGIFEQRLLGHGRGCHGRHWHRGCRTGGHFPAHPIDVAGDELKLGMAIPGAAGVGQRHPALEFDTALVGRQFGDVIRRPGKPARQIVEFHRQLARRVAADLGDQGGARAQIGWHFGEDDAAGRLGLDTVADLEHHAIGHAQHLGLLHGLLAGLGIGDDDAHGAAHRFLQQLFRRQQVEIEILLQHVELPAGGFQQRRFRLDMATDVDEGDIVLALDQGHDPPIAHEGQILVVDGDGHARLIVQADALLLGHRGQGEAESDQAGGGEQFTTHDGFPLRLEF